MINKIWTKFTYAVIIALTLSACNNDDDEQNLPALSDNSIIVCNEGSFQAGNGSLTYYDSQTKESTKNIYSVANGMPLGDIVYTGVFADDALYVVVNNSQKIEKLNPETFESMGKVEGLVSPRYYEPIDASKAYVTDLFGGSVSIINPVDMTITGSISIPGWTEQMLQVGNTVWITNPGSDQLYGINNGQDAITDSITIIKDATSIVQDVNGKVWVLCIPDWQTPREHEGALFKIDINTQTIEQRFDFGSMDYPANLCINGEGNRIFWLNGGVYSMNVSATNLPNSEFIPQRGIAYGLSVDPNTNDIYMTDGGDFTSDSKVYRFSSNGDLIDEIEVGIAPNNIIFQ